MTDVPTRDIPLSVLDLAPVVSGGNGAEALADSLDLAAELDRLGYRRVWFAEHHLTPGVASAAPAVLAALVAERTRRIRVGSGAVVLSHTSPLVALEQFATIARIHPGRVDLGLGRAAIATAQRQAAGTGSPTASTPAAAPRTDEVVDGVVIPAPPPFTLTDPAVREVLAARGRVVGTRADIPSFVEEVRLVLDLLAGEHVTPDGRSYASPLTTGADLEVWPLASSGGESATVAGELGLPLAANYHVSPATVRQTVESYRRAFRPGVLSEPYVAVSADVVVAPTEGEARRLTAGYPHFVRTVRDLSGAEPYRSPEEAAGVVLSEEEERLVHDRLVTQIVGAPDQAAAQLRALARVTGADELIVTTITHRHADRVRSYRLLAQEWGLDAAPAERAALTAVR
jgi:alkanesulfonate monooxygenase SsuD/methylene tetrahydromethanopterin reductase-like flavin-dependent oxidoreductase (luciferase family)